MAQTGPRDTDSVMASRYGLTAKGCEATGGHSWTWQVTPNSVTCRHCGTTEDRAVLTLPVKGGAPGA